ncbi:MAG TPA: tRNA (adenosine(37)-N6)-threonylcarbamoyltransferase complex ATPase subunit type 1 TsaE [Verrucomicrobiae bacterium]|nr:tRNA (adenosine(37)-N6)-threonylcarbamoyltransferase complex ATPase subunit type 1 TsaE [Verrucomicrobiae bacterium]
MVTCISHSPSETQALGEAWGRDAMRGWVIALTGHLGSGKTQLVKGLARGLGFSQLVLSPTFALVHTYAGGRLTLFHLDLYRLETPEQVVAAGLTDYLQPDGVTVIEWAERFVQRALDATGEPGEGRGGPTPLISLHSNMGRGSVPLRMVRIETLSERERRIVYEDIGS